MKTVQDKLNFLKDLRNITSRNIETHLAKPIKSITLWPNDENINVENYPIEEIIKGTSDPQRNLKPKNINDFNILVFDKNEANPYSHEKIDEKNEEYYKDLVKIYKDLVD